MPERLNLLRQIERLLFQYAILLVVEDDNGNDEDLYKEYEWLLTVKCMILSRRYMTVRSRAPKTTRLRDLLFHLNGSQFKQVVRVNEQTF